MGGHLHMLCVLLVLASMKGCRALFLQEGKQGESPVRYTILLKDLITVTLSDENILFICDPNVEEFISLTEIFSWAAQSLKSYTFLYWDDFNNSAIPFPEYFLRGSSIMIFLLYHRDPTLFMDIHNISKVWNPDYLILFGVSTKISSDLILSHGVIQRSLHVTLVEYSQVGDRNDFIVYKMNPKIPGLLNNSKIKIELGIYDTQRFNSRNEFFVESRFDLKGAVFNLSAWCFDQPFVLLNSDETACEGVNVDILSIFAEKYGFTYNIPFVTSDGLWGSKVNDTWTGMMGDLAYKGKHLVMHTIVFVEEVFEDFDITYPYFSESIGILVAEPRPLPKWLGIFFPFSTIVWTLLISTTMLVITMIMIILHLVEAGQTYDTAFLLVLSPILRQSYPENIQKSWVHLWLLCWWWTSFVLTCAYTSNLMACLTIPVVPPRMETLEALAATAIRATSPDFGGTLPDAMCASHDPSLRELGHRMDLFPVEGDHSYIEHGLPLVLAGSHVLVDAYSYLAVMIYRSDFYDKTYFLKEQGLPMYQAWMFPKNTPYTATFSLELQRLSEAGIVAKLYKEHMGALKVIRENSIAQALSLEHFQGPFLVLGLGMSVSCLVFMGELLMYRSRRRSHEQE